MGILNFDIPKKIRSADEHNIMYCADGAVPGTYVPNMSKEDMYRWKAKHIRGANERVEIRKTIIGTQMVVIVSRDEIKISSNSAIHFSPDDWNEFLTAVQEAKDILNI